MHITKKIILRIREEGLIKFFYRFLLFLFIRHLRFKRFVRFVFLRRKEADSLIVRRINGSDMYLDLDDKGLSRDLFLSGIREPFATDIVEREIQKGDVIIDIGSNLGYYTLLASRLVGEKGKVYAIEPLRSSVEILKRSIAHNNYTNIEVYQLAIGEDARVGYLYEREKRNASSFFEGDRPGASVIKKYRVDVVSIDIFLEGKSYPNFIRMDVEGYEREIVMGMKKTLLLKKPLKILMEFHPPYMMDRGSSVLRALKDAGFHTKYIAVDRSSLVIREGKLIRRAFNFLNRQLELEEISPFDAERQEQKEKLLRRNENFFQILFERA